MEKINKSLSKVFLPLVVYREDLEKLVDVLSATGNDVKINVDDYSYESISELIEHRGLQQYNSMEIQSRNPYCNIKLCPLSAELYVSGDDSCSSSGVFYQLDKILMSCLRKPSFAYSYYTIWAINIGFPVGWSFFESVINNNFLLDIFYFIPFVWVFYVLFIRLKKHSTITLVKQSEASNFFKRNKDQILLLIFGTIFGILVSKAWDKAPFNQEMALSDKVNSQEEVEK